MEPYFKVLTRAKFKMQQIRNSMSSKPWQLEVRLLEKRETARSTEQVWGHGVTQAEEKREKSPRRA